jgi:hypothetical protein
LILLFVLVAVTAIFVLLTDSYDRDVQFYIALISLLISIGVSTYAMDMDMFFTASKMNDFPQRMAFLTLCVIYETFVIISIIIFYIIKRVEVNVFASIMIGWLIIFVVLTYSLLLLNRFISSNMATGRAFSMKRGDLQVLIQKLELATEMKEDLKNNTLLNQKMKDLTETIKFSDPVSRKEVEDIDSSIINEISLITSMVEQAASDEEVSGIIQKMHHIKSLVERRNQMLLSLK